MLFVLCADVCFEKASISTECCRRPDYMLPQIRLHHSNSVRSIHWLPVNERIKFTILLLTFEALHQQAPTYIQDLWLAIHRLELSGHPTHYA